MQEISENEFDSKVAAGTVLVDFGAEWCGPCKTMLPILERVNGSYAGKVSIYSVDTDKDPALAARHGVMSLPTMILFKNGQMVDRMVGVVPERELKKRIDETIA